MKKNRLGEHIQQALLISDANCAWPNCNERECEMKIPNERRQGKLFQRENSRGVPQVNKIRQVNGSLFSCSTIASVAFGNLILRLQPAIYDQRPALLSMETIKI